MGRQFKQGGMETASRFKLVSTWSVGRSVAIDRGRNPRFSRAKECEDGGSGGVHVRFRNNAMKATLCHRGRGVTVFRVPVAGGEHRFASTQGLHAFFLIGEGAGIGFVRVDYGA